jgi:hypothetical protein
VPVRPGPEWIDPGRAPGGFVVRAYSTFGHMLTESCIGPDTDWAADSAASAIEAKAKLTMKQERICLVIYDGTTGERWSPAMHAMALALLRPDVGS